MPEEMLEAHPLLGFRIDLTSDTPTVAMIRFQTSKGTSYFAVTKEILDQLAKEFGVIAAEMPAFGEFH